jgi:hypothetical protein
MTRLLRVGLIGPSRRVNGTGPFVARFLSELGADVVAVASRSHATATEAASQLRSYEGSSPEPMRSVDELFHRDGLDCVAVCSPSVLHEEHIRSAIARGLHIFCEKPLTWGPVGTLHNTTLEIARLCSKSGLVLHENTQWVHTLYLFREIYGDIVPDRVDDVEIELSPPCHEPDAMLRETFPHVASLVIWTTDAKALDEISTALRPGHIEISAKIVRAQRHHSTLRTYFSYAQCPPRSAAYALNGKWLRRRIFEKYRITFESNGIFYDCVDPLRQSVSVFLNKVSRAIEGEKVAFANESVSAAAMTDAVRATLNKS